MCRQTGHYYKRIASFGGGRSGRKKATDDDDDAEVDVPDTSQNKVPYIRY